jgi:hypothetical protein
MKIYLLSCEDTHLPMPDWNYYDAFVIKAKTPNEALSLANNKQKEIWKVKSIGIARGVKPEIILGSFN